MRGSPSQNISLLGGLDAEKQLKKSSVLPFSQKSKMADMFFLTCASSSDSDGSYGIIYLGSILSVSGARAIHRQTTRWTSRQNCLLQSIILQALVANKVRNLTYIAHMFFNVCFGTDLL